MNNRRENSRSLYLAVWGVFVFPLLTVLIAKLLISNFYSANAPPSYVIDLNYTPSTSPGIPDLVEGLAPPNMELAIYLDDKLLNITQTDNNGKFSYALPVLAGRRNNLAVLPTQIDTSTLILFYIPEGFQRVRPIYRLPDPEAPFLAYSNWTKDGLQVYGSTEAVSEIEIYPNTCDGNTSHLNAKSDNEGSFQGLIPFSGITSNIKELCARIRNQEKPTWIGYVVPMPTQNSPTTFHRSINLDFSQTGAKLTFSVQMPTGYRIYQNLVKGNISELDFIKYVFGDVTLNTYIAPDQIQWRQEKQADSDTVLILLETVPLKYLIPEDDATTFKIDSTDLSDALPPYTFEDSINITLDAVRVLESDPAPTSSTEKQYTWVGALSKTRSVKIWVTRSADVVVDPIQKARLKDTLSSLLSDIGVAPGSFLEKTIEGGIVGVLPARAPNPARAQVYAYYKSLYEKEPLITPVSPTDTLRSFVRDLPLRLPNTLVNILYGCLWLIPSGMLFWEMHKQSLSGRIPPATDNLTTLAWGVTILVVLSMNWLSVFNRIGLTRNDYLIWITSGYVILLVFLSRFHARFRSLASSNVFGGILLTTAISLVLTGLSAALLFIVPDRLATTVLTGLFLLTLASLSWRALVISTEQYRLPALGFVFVALTIIIIASLPIEGLPYRAQLPMFLGILHVAPDILRALTPFVLLAGLTVLLANKFDRPIGTSQKGFERAIGRIALVAFAVGFSPSWGFVPVSAILALVLFEWLLPKKALVASNQMEKFVKENQRQAVSTLLDLNREQVQWRLTDNDLQKQLRDGKLKLEKYRAQVNQHEDRIMELNRPDFMSELPPKLSVRDVAFNFGAGPRLGDNLRQALAWSAILLIPLTILHGWPLVSTEIQTALPFPFLYIASRLGVFIGQFLAMAIFLGYFFPYLRGRNGLEKAGWLAGIVIISQLPVKLLMTGSTIEMMALVFWAGTILAYNLLLGLLAFDMQTLNELGLRWHRLTDLYNLRELAVYLTGSGTPLITTIFSVIFGNLQDLIPAILRVVFPSMSLTEAQNQLLQVLLDLASRLATKIIP